MRNTGSRFSGNRTKGIFLMIGIGDRDVELLAEYSKDLQKEYEEDDETWEGSSFAWIRSRPSRQKGTIGEKLVSRYLKYKGFDVKRSPDRDADRVINQKRVEIKSSTLWKNGFYKFQQLRDQNYSFAICLGISPGDVHCWVLPKEVIMEQWRIGGIRSQHGGQDGRDTAWLQVDPDNVQNWLREWGGNLSKATLIITRIIKMC